MPERHSRVVIITGGSSGIGAATARACLEAGMTVAIVARDRERLAATATELDAGRGRVLAVRADVTRESDMRTMVSRVLAAFGRVDVLVCSAGLGYQGTLDETPAEVVLRLLEVNVIGTANAARAVLPYFEGQRSGHLVVIGSIVGKRGIPGYAAYSAAKFAQTGLAEALRAEWRESGIAVTTVFPVSVDTGFRAAVEREFGVRIEGGGPRQSAAVVAAAIVRGIERRPPEVFPLRRARLLVWVNALAPSLADRIALRFARRRSSTASSPVASGDPAAGDER